MPSLSLVPITYLAMSACAAALIVLFRYPMGEPAWSAIFKAFLLSGAVMLTWHAAGRQVVQARWCSYALALLATLLVLFSPAISWLGEPFASFALYAILGALWLTGLWSLVRGVRPLPTWQVLAAVAVGLVLGITHFLIVNSKSYASVLTPELTLLGLQFRDTLYHASIAAMLGKYGVSSTGLDGLLPVPYHALVHAWIGTIGRWLDVAPTHAFYLASQIIGIPLLYFALSAAVCWLWQPKVRDAAALLCVIVPIALLQFFMAWDWASFLVSESYFFSLILLLLTLPLLLEIIDRPVIGCGTVRYVVLGIALAAMLYAKISVGMVFAAGLYYALVRSYGLTTINLLKFGVPIVLIVFAAMRSVVQAPTIFEPLHFIYANPGVALANLVAIGLAVAGGVAAARTAKNLKTTIAAETFIVLALAGLVPGLLLRIEGGSGYYFVNIGVWVGIVFIAAYVLGPMLAARARPVAVTVAGIAIAMLTVIGQPALRNSGPSLATLLARIAPKDQKTALPQDASTIGLWTKLLSPSDRTRAHIVRKANKSMGGQIYAALRDAGLPNSRDQVVFVPPENTAFWHIDRVCVAQPFFVPATIAVPMVNGLYPDGARCPNPAEGAYGYHSYSEASRSRAFSDDELCAKVRQVGFTKVVIVEQPQRLRKLDCDTRH